jgi:hypothetical protein
MLMLSVPLQAAVSDSEFEALRAEFAALAQRLTTLESENAELKAANAQTIQDVAVSREQVAALEKRKSAASWTETVRWKGDFRYRYENIDEEGRDDRDRNRVRARAALIANLPDDIEVGLGVASGGDDPVSTNQTLGGGGSTKDIRLDLAYANWNAMDGLNLLGGKFKNVWYRPGKNGLIFDGDFNPEGVGVVYKKDWFFANLVGTWLESDTRGENDSYSWGGQLGFKGSIAGARVVAGGAWYNFDTEGKSTFFGDDDDFFGNSFECADPDDLGSCVYAFDYNIGQAFAEVSMNVGDMPVSLFADYVVNDDADDEDTGYAVGVKVGKTKGRGTWQLAYTYQDLEADAVLGLLTDSDFGGGGTDGEGHVFKGSYGVNKKWSVGVTYFLNEVNENAGNKHDYDRIMIDTQFKY